MRKCDADDDRPVLLRRFPLAQSCSIEEVEHILAKLNSSVSLEQVEHRAPFEWRANRAAMGHLGITVGSWTAGVRGYAPDVGVYSLLIGLHSGGRVTQRGRAACIAPGKTAALASPGMDGVFEFGSEHQGLQVMIPCDVMSAALGALTGAAQPALPRFEPEVDLRSSGGASVLRLLRFVLDEVEQTDGILVSPLVVGRLADTLVSALLTSLPHDGSHLLRSPSRPAEPACLSRVEEYIRENLTDPITIADLARVAGVGGRAVQAAFLAHRGCSPMAFVRAQRFELARRRLLASPGATVASIALECGFEHLGRFSVAYRARFGESPMETRRRAHRG